MEGVAKLEVGAAVVSADRSGRTPEESPVSVLEIKDDVVDAEARRRQTTRQGSSSYRILLPRQRLLLHTEYHVS